MKEFKSKTVVITGAASGIGRALSLRFAAEGMNLVLADIEEAPLAKVESEIRANGVKTLSVVMDVSKAEQVESLAQKSYDTFGAVHIVCNNAGVFRDSLTWQTPLEDWKWIMGVNLWGVIHGIRSFVPRMIEQNTEGHILNTASINGFIFSPLQSVYQATKFAVVSISESLYHELNMMQSKLKVSVLCPGWVKTKIWEAGRNRPNNLGGESFVSAYAPNLPPMLASMEQEKVKAIDQAPLPEDVAEQALAAIRDEQFYILNHPEYDRFIRTRMQNILNRKNPG